MLKEVTEESSTGTFVLSFESRNKKSQKSTPKRVSFCGDENFEVVTTSEQPDAAFDDSDHVAS